jgi:uncharacterized protein YcfJ
MRGALQTLVLLCVWATTGPAAAGAFRSYATVLDVQPIVETIYEPVAREVCTDPDATAREFTELSATIGEDIRRQLRLWQSQRSCRTITERQARERITAYRVTYRYRGYTSTTQLPYHPGDRLPVNVSLSPLP